MTKSIAVLTVLAACLTATPPAAHEAPTGWRYDAKCCQNRDCRPLSADAIKEGPDGYLITIGKVTIPYRDPRVKDSPDGLFHWCSVNGKDDGRTICLYVPPRGT